MENNLTNCNSFLDYKQVKKLLKTDVQAKEIFSFQYAHLPEKEGKIVAIGEKYAQSIRYVNEKLPSITGRMDYLSELLKGIHTYIFTPLKSDFKNVKNLKKPNFLLLLPEYKYQIPIVCAKLVNLENFQQYYGFDNFTVVEEGELIVRGKDSLKTYLDKALQKQKNPELSDKDIGLLFEGVDISVGIKPINELGEKIIKSKSLEQLLNNTQNH